MQKQLSLPTISELGQRVGSLKVTRNVAPLNATPNVVVAPGRGWINLAGMKFNRLRVVGISRVVRGSRRSQYFWACKCDCGNDSVVVGGLLRSGHAVSCGCVRNEKAKMRFTTHGKSGTPTYKTWKNMLTRCFNPKNSQFHDYGGRGITACDSWRKFKNFLRDMGEKPDKTYQLERVDNNAGYNKDNCIWATVAVQCVNRRNNHKITFRGETLTISQWSVKTGLSTSLLYDRINKLKWTVEESLTIPPIPHWAPRLKISMK